MRFTIITALTIILVLFFAQPAMGADLSNQYVTIDDRSSSKGFVNVSIIKSTDNSFKAKISKDGRDYLYTIPDKERTFQLPLQMGDGTYDIRILEKLEKNRYATLFSTSIRVTISDPLAPFLNSHVLINYESAPNTVAVAREITGSSTNDIEKLQAVYSNVVNRISYDFGLANKIIAGQVTSYVPDVDEVYANKKGICFDYSAVMASMLRSQGVPTRMVFGYVAPRNLYHAWNEVYVTNIGWVKVRGAIQLSSQQWSRMDATFAANNGYADMTSFIGNAENYKTTDIY